MPTTGPDDVHHDAARASAGLTNATGSSNATGGVTFIEVQLDPSAAAEDGISLRFKAAGPSRPVREVPYESEDGLAGAWSVLAVDADGAPSARGAFAVPVEDSSDGTALLVVGGTGGLRLTHLATAAQTVEPYLVLAIATLVA